MLTPHAALAKDMRSGSGVMPLQHRHYAAIAAAVRDLPVPIRATVADYFSDWFANRYGNFDAARFLRACEPEADPCPPRACEAD